MYAKHVRDIHIMWRLAAVSTFPSNLKLTWWSLDCNKGSKNHVARPTATAMSAQPEPAKVPRLYLTGDNKCATLARCTE